MDKEERERAELWVELVKNEKLFEETLLKIIQNRPLSPKLMENLRKAGLYSVDSMEPPRKNSIHVISARGRPTHITEKERVVFLSTAAGLTNQETADVLNVSVETVKSQVSNVIRSLEARNSIHAVFILTKQGIL